MAIVSVFFIFRCPAGRDNTKALVALRVNNTQNLAAAHAEKNNPLLAVGRTCVDPLNAERIAEGLGGLLKGHAMLANVRSGLGVIPFKI
jgi:hypothetical protein